MANDGDAALVRRARAGERDAFACLVRQHYPLVLALCRRVLGPAASAEDAAQEAVLAAMLQLDRLRRADRFGPWLAGIGLNVCRQLLRERSRALDSWGTPIYREPVDGTPDPADLAADGDVAARVRAAVMALPPGQRAAVLLHYLAGLSQPEVAATLGVEPGAVKTRLHKARRSLRQPLQPLWTEEPMANRSKPKPKPGAEPVEVEVESVRVNLDTGGRVAVLREKEGDQRFLPIWMGNAEADSIVIHMQRIATPRPQTHDLTMSLLGAAGTRVREVVVERLAEKVFYATIALDGPGGPAAVDARPSDAIALAVRAGAPIKVHPDVLASAGVAPATIEADDAAGHAAVEELIGKLGPRAAAAVAGAKEATTTRFKHGTVGAMQLLFALAEEGGGAAADVLRARGVTPERVASAFEARFGRREGPGEGLVRSYWRLKSVLTAAEEEARALGHARAGTGHLLLGIQRAGGEATLDLLQRLGLEPDATREAILADMSRDGGAPDER